MARYFPSADNRGTRGYPEIYHILQLPRCLCQHSDPRHGLTLAQWEHTGAHSRFARSSMFWGDIIHAQRVQLHHPEVTVVFDIDPTAAAATRHELLPKLAREDVLIAGPHIFPALGHLRKEGTGYCWVPVAFTDQSVENAPSPQK